MNNVEKNSGEKKKILLSCVSTETKAEIIKALGESAYEFPEAREQGLDEPADLLIVEKNTIDITSKLHDKEAVKKVPVLYLLSGKAKLPEEETKQLAVDQIHNPFDTVELVSKVQSLLKRTDIIKQYGSQPGVEKTFVKLPNKVLIVDDDIQLNRLFTYNLTKAGYEVRTAFDGLEGFEAAKEFEPDIIVSDIMMPIADGYKFRELLLADSNLKTIPFVFLTAKGSEQDILDGYNLEIDDYIIKTSGPKVIVAKVSAVLKSHEKERNKMVSEIHQAADSLRAKVVPDSCPLFEGFDIKHWHQPFKGIPGGDFIDYFNLDEDNLAIILGDVMGKRWGAWYFAFAYAGYVRSAIRVVLQSSDEHSPSQLLQKINESIYQDAKVSEVFATLSIVILDRKTRTAKYAGAGDLPVIYKSGTGNVKVEMMKSQGLLLGFSFDGGYEDIVLTVNNGDSLTFITDGIVESRNPSGLPFGNDKLLDFIKSLDPGDDPIERIKSELSSFTCGNFEDDISLISVKVVN